ncbi:hypothetical protein M3Y14_30470 [Bacillus thuringiensis]|uniref:hypothetical protein n=1 Tax=Bacillus thuringiensis TaxID=1428 RepID=UPI0022241248|nr:hypothetical protein [Bacillus thuringiensis]UYX52595.1 hypothetical protein M3Y14_30470 [Bacillus thuringiensis]
MNLPVYKKVLSLFMLGDFRAQGILPKTVLGRVFLGVSTLFYLIPIYLYLNKNYDTATFQEPNLIILFTFILIFSLFIFNSLGVGSLTNTSSIDEIKALLAFPLFSTDLINIRIIMGIFRGYLFNMICIIPVVLAIISKKGILHSSLYLSLLSFLVLPLLPSLIGILLNLKTKALNLQVCVVLLCIYLFAGMTFLTSVNSIPSQLSEVIFVLSYPIWAILGKLNVFQNLVFVGIWIMLSLIILLMIYKMQKKRVYSISGTTWNERIASQIAQRCKGAKLLYCSLVIGRVSILSIFIEIFVVTVMSYIVIWSIQDISINFIKMLILTLTSVSLPMIVLFPILKSSIGKVAEHRKLQCFPIPSNWHVLIPFGISMFILVIILGGFNALIGAFLDSKMVLYYSIYLIFGSLSLGTLLIHLMMSPKKIIASLYVFIFSNVKLTILISISIFYVNSILTLSLSALIDVLYLGFYMKFFIHKNYLTYLEGKK